MERIKTIAPSEKKYSPYQFERDGCIGAVHLASCMSCKKYKSCKRRIQIRNILFEALDKIEEQTDIKKISQVCVYNIFKPECGVANDRK